LCSSSVRRFFVVRTKANVLLQRRYSHPVDKSTGRRSDQTVFLVSFESVSVYPDPLRKINYYGTSANAVKTQIWIAVSAYVLAAVRKRLGLN